MLDNSATVASRKVFIYAKLVKPHELPNGVFDADRRSTGPDI